MFAYRNQPAKPRFEAGVASFDLPNIYNAVRVALDEGGVPMWSKAAGTDDGGHDWTQEGTHAVVVDDDGSIYAAGMAKFQDLDKDVLRHGARREWPGPHRHLPGLAHVGGADRASGGQSDAFVPVTPVP